MQKSISVVLKSIFGKSKKTPKPITWEIKTKKTGFNTYEIHIIAFVSHPWWIYPQESTRDGIFPTAIKFEENTFLSLIGKPQEIGVLKEVYDETSKTKIRFYASAVIFVQEIIVYRQPELLTAKIIFTACTAKGCLNPQEMEFKIELD
ncbi:hypothetical protein [Flavobacterium degerlachei]|uniref:Thiol:disulfide interchange protein DsbD N-terminal domain-containing protein n=1 Tax=Flavobacterium degerlachei TaxID=229203 RepID=A0A1H3E9C3_9FLAO|nr:hypothetical protein [Flavobacterium degerlachei]SDX74868.1 hypothetical protein SAMN05444338_11471 [Flavobacterium degerlachei]